MNTPTKSIILDGVRMDLEYQICHEIVTNVDKNSTPSKIINICTTLLNMYQHVTLLLLKKDQNPSFWKVVQINQV